MGGLRMQAQAKIGLMALGLAAYWPQFEGIRERLLGHFGEVVGKFEGLAEVIDLGLVDSIEGARAANAAMRTADVDLIVCHLTTYATSEPMIIAVAGLDVPVLLLNVQSVSRQDPAEVKSIGDWLGTAISCAALPEMSAVLLRTGRRFDIVTGYLDGDRVVDEAIAAWCRVASVRRMLRTSSLGLLHRPYPGMTDLYIDETAFFARLGAYTQHLNWDDVAAELAGGGVAETAVRRPAIEAAFDTSNTDDEALDSIARVLVAFDRLIEKHGLCGLPNHYEGPVAVTHAEILAASNPAFSVLMQEGIACPVEGDIKTALAMLALKRIAGTATLAELYSMDFDNDLVILGHSGAADPSLSSRKPQLKRSAVFHGKSGSGYLTQTYPKAGPMTLLSLLQRADGGFALCAAEGEIVDGPAMELGDTNCRVRFSLGVREFVTRWSKEGPTHHGVMGLGHHVADLRKLSALLDLPLTVIC
jgi:L-arabinose isomerase